MFGRWLLFLSACLFLAVSAEAQELILQHTFQSETGFPVQLKTQVNERSKILVLFWAGWCVPCKEELLFVKERTSALGFAKVVAINVDDSSGWPKAQSFLAALNLPFLSLRDDGGQFFYSYQSSGQLPLALLLDESGQVVLTLEKLDDPAIERMAQLAPAEGKEFPWKIGVQGFYRQHRSSNETEREILAALGNVRFSHGKIESQVQYNFLKQTEKGAVDASATEDEVGFSFLQVHSGRWLLRGGDDDLSLFEGRLFSAQNLKGTAETSSVLGGHVKYLDQRWTLQIFAGRIRPALFPSLINPTLDASITLPAEKAIGGMINSKLLEGSQQLEVRAGWVDYERSQNDALGYPQAHHDRRWAGGVYWGSIQKGLKIDVVSYDQDSGSLATDADRPYLVQPVVWWSPEQRTDFYLAVSYLEYQSLAPRTLRPVLTEDPGQPLSAQKIRSIKLAPRWTLGNWFIEPSFTREAGIFVSPDQSQNTYALALTNPQHDGKFTLVQQEGQLSASETHKERGAISSWQFTEVFSAQLTYKNHRASSETGETYSALGGVRLSQLVPKNHLGQLDLQAQWCHQAGYYIGFSGIDRRDLFSAGLSWRKGSQSLRLVAGSEPGGVVCTNGYCMQKPPLNGLAMDGIFEF